jgi:hypothetical protein
MELLTALRTAMMKANVVTTLMKIRKTRWLVNIWSVCQHTMKLSARSFSTVSLNLSPAARGGGGKHVIAAALRNNEDSVEVDVARNGEFAARDDEYLSFLTQFLAIHGEGTFFVMLLAAEEIPDLTLTLPGLSSQDIQSSGHKSLDTTLSYIQNRTTFWIGRAAKDLKNS